MLFTERIVSLIISVLGGIYFPSIDRDWYWQEPPFIHQIVAENEYSLELRGTGTPQHVIWTITGNDHTYPVEIMARDLFYQFPSSGTYQIRAAASNAYSQYTTQEASLTVLDAIVGLYLISNSPGIEGEVVTFVALVQECGSNSTFSINYGDGFSEVVPEPRRDSNVMRFIPTNLALPSDPMKSNVAVMNHTYDTTGVYAARLIGSNAAMEWIAIAYVQIENNVHPCKIPAIHIRDGGSNYYQAKKYSRRKSFIFGAAVKIDCWRANRADYRWSVYKTESLFTVPSTSNQVTLPSSINTQAADIYVPQFTLGYGLYIFRLTVTLVMKHADDASMESIAHSYIKVIPSDLVARIRGGTLLAIGEFKHL